MSLLQERGYQLNRHEKGSPNPRPKITHPSTAQLGENLSHRAAEAVFRTPLPEHLVRERERQRQRRISRKKNGVRVSRRLPSRGTQLSLGDDNQYSLMQVSEFTEDHPYWGTLRHSQIPNMNSGRIKAAGKRPVYREGGPTQPATNYDQHPSKPKQTGQTTQPTGGRRTKGMSVSGQSRGPVREKRSLDQQRRLSTLVIPEDAVAESDHLSDVPSRTSSQRKNLNRFTRQLTKYADAAAVAGTAPAMTPTESESKLSYHTVQQLLPYRKEFQRVGLAVTSAEQSRRSPIKPEGSRQPINHPLRVVVESVCTSTDSDEQDEAESEDSCSSSGSFVEFTPGGSLIEALPSPIPMPKQKSPSKGKGIFPWLKKKSPAREVHVEQHEPQRPRPRPLAGDIRVQSQPRTIDPKNVRGLRKSHAFKDLPLLPPAPPTPTKPPLGSTKPFINPASSKRPPLRTLPSIDVKQNRGELRPELASSRAGPGPGPRQSAMHTGLRRRDGAAPRVPRPETIEEEKENSPTRTIQTTIHLDPLPEPKGTPAPSVTIGQQSQGVSPQTTPSTVPSLPYPARHASRRPSSLERALDEVSEQLEKMEQQADKLDQICSRPPTLIERTNLKESHIPSPESNQQPAMTAPSRPLKSTEEVIYTNQKTPSIETPHPRPKKPLPPPPEPTKISPSPPHKRPLPSPPVDKTLPRLPKTEDLLNDLDVFFDYDDADINDRDVIKGLQVAIHAAADNVIRRFLADLRAVGEMQQENPKGQRDRGNRKSLVKV
ncbi:hypothetical protein F4805DRAFT_471531 [Annulohypoxylon moriforme]|nr:hypothetical protein F4805DRAFT_471531 [Annulohypoxylon moriforme]